MKTKHRRKAKITPISDGEERYSIEEVAKAFERPVDWVYAIMSGPAWKVVDKEVRKCE